MVFFRKSERLAIKEKMVCFLSAISLFIAN